MLQEGDRLLSFERVPVLLLEPATDGAGEGVPERGPEQFLRGAVEQFGGSLIDVCELPPVVEGHEPVVNALVDALEPLGGGLRPLPGTVSLDGVRDAVGQDHEPLGVRAFLDVVGDAGAYRLAGHLLASLPGEEDERQVGVLLADRLEKLDAVRPWHVVVGDDAVDLAEPFDGRRRLRLVDDVHVVFGLQNPLGEAQKGIVVVQVQHADGSPVVRGLALPIRGRFRP